MGLRKSYIISKSFRSYLLATLLTLVIGQVCLTTDGIIMSHLISPDALSAINLMSPFNMIMATVHAYGATECAPMITFSDYKKKRQCSCGTAVTGMELRVDSPHPHTEAGEILARGGNTMLGYYKNPEATALALDADGWYHTGDNGVIDDDGYLFIRGRKKNMLLGPNGQNIYPEEIEDQLNTLLLVSESLVVQRDSQLVALVHPDYDEANELGLSDENIRNIMKLNATDINELIPSYEHIHHIEIHEDEFEKTAKKTLKRYLYR